MSKSLDNHIDLAATAEETAQRVSGAFTDPQRTRRNIPGRPEICNVYSLHKIFSSGGDVSTVYDECTTAQRGCVQCKRQLADNINSYLEPLRERRQEFQKRPDYVKDILSDGAVKAQAIARNTIEEVYEKMGLA
jgi:tryptophanyl-tRNA synthetase